MDAPTLLRRLKLRGCTEVTRRAGIALVQRGDLRTTVPMFAGDVPRALIARIEADLGVDVRRRPQRHRR